MADRYTNKTITAPIMPTPTKTPTIAAPITPTPTKTPTDKQHRTTRPIQRYRQRNQAFNPYWNNPSGFIETDQTLSTNNNVENTNDIGNKYKHVNTDNNNNKMTIDDDKTKSAVFLRDEMQWTNRPNKTPSILEVLEYKAAAIEGLRHCPYRGNKKGTRF